ncbi:MAG: endonuclease/exonuclease/phosphatase family protein [Alphaproteobacteria bacterium]
MARGWRIAHRHGNKMVLARILLAILCAGVLAPSNGRALDIQQVQGRGHVSPLLGQDVEGVEGVVTAVLSTGSRRGFFMQDARPGGDGDPWTSDALFVSTGSTAPMVAPGDAVRVAGRVAEQRGGNDSLAVTQLADASVVVMARGVPLPAPTTIGASGRAPPTRIAPDIGGSVEGPAHRFDPVANAIDFDETLEGMRVRVTGAVAIGPRNSCGAVPILPARGAGAGLRSARGAMGAGPGGAPAGRLVADDALIGSAAMPRARVGDRLGDVEGVMDYAFAAWRLLLTAPPGLDPGGLLPEVAAPARPGEVSIAAFNVQNLSGASRAAKFAAIARQVAGTLRAPEILALSEIQDSDGTVDSGTVSATRTYDRLLAAIAAAGGPRYAVAQVDPADGADGGAPGGNIRVAFLYDPARVDFVPRPGGAADVAVGLLADGGLDANPGRVAPADPAWGSAPDGSDGSRKPLAAEFGIAGRRIVLVAAHLKSKSEDQPDFGRYQSPAAPGDMQRLAQAGVIADFVRRLAEADPDAGIAVLGDFNDGGESATLARLAEAGLADLALTLPSEERYSYVFEGVAEDLDHVLVNEVLRGGAALDIVHVNAEFLPSERASDHDPLLVRLSFALPVPEPPALPALLPAAALALARARRRARGNRIKTTISNPPRRLSPLPSCAACRAFLA